MREMNLTQKKIIIRADGNAKIGAGHLMGCLTIAEALPRENVLFLCADEASGALAEEYGYEVFVLQTDFQNMMEEIRAWENLLKGETNSRKKRTILVDSYFVTNAYLAQLKKYGTVVLLEDMAKEAFDADIIINYNAFAQNSMYQALNSPYTTEYLTGGRYIPIRRAFCEKDYKVKDVAKHILITTGGGDQENIAGQILESIWNGSCQYHLVTGRFNPHFEILQDLAERKGNLHIYHDVKDMASLMTGCDVAVTAGGTTIYELSAIGVPFVCFSYAENQEKLTEYIGQNKVAGFGGAFHKQPGETLQEIARQVELLTKDMTLRKQYSIKEKELVDGKGAARIAEMIWRNVC